MDPLTALSLAGNIVQFVDFSSKLLSAGRELYKSTTGSLTVNDEIELVTSDLLAIARKLRPDQNLGLEFRQMCDEAVRLAQDLLRRLDKLKVKTRVEDGVGKKELDKEKWKSAKQALASVWFSKDMTALVDRLSKIREAIETRILLSLRYVLKPLHSRLTCFMLPYLTSSQELCPVPAVLTISTFREDVNHLSSHVSGRFDNLDKQTRQIISALVAQLGASSERSSRDVQDQTMALTQLLCRFEETNLKEHSKTREMISKYVRETKQIREDEYEVI
jgi:hypothetical protein